MHVNVRLFASHREAAGLASYAAEVPDGALARDILNLLYTRFPSLKTASRNVAFAVNQKQVSPDVVLHDGDELALLPPMAGG